MLKRTTIEVYEDDALDVEAYAAACDMDVAEFMGDLFANFLLEQANIDGYNYEKWQEIREEQRR